MYKASPSKIKPGPSPETGRVDALDQQTLVGCSAESQRLDLAIIALIERIHILEQTIAEHTDLLQGQQREIAKHREALSIKEREGSALTQRLADAELRNTHLSKQLRHYRQVFDRLEHNFGLVVASARWKIGHRLISVLEIMLRRAKPQLVMAEIPLLFQATRNWDAAPTPDPNGKKTQDLSRLRAWLGLLDADLRALEQSMRWRVGNFLVRLIEIGIGRRRVPLAIDHLRETFDQAKNWVPSGDDRQDLRQLAAWFSAIDRELRALLSSKRWLLGNHLLGALDRILWRGKPKLVVDHMREILDQYDHWRHQQGLSS